MRQQSFLNFGEASENGVVGSQFFSHFDESTDDINAHGGSVIAVEDHSRLSNGMIQAINAMRRNEFGLSVHG